MRGSYTGPGVSRLAVAVAVVVGGWLSMAPAWAAPPTVTPSPGYDARLQEQRAARTYSTPANEPVVPYHRPLSRRHVRRIHDGAR